MASKGTCSKQDGLIQKVNQPIESVKINNERAEKGAKSPNETAKILNEHAKGVRTVTITGRSVEIPGKSDDTGDKTNDGKYKRENTVTINIEEKEIKVDELLDCVENTCGQDTVLACVPCGRNVYELTMVDNNCRDVLIPEIHIGNVSLSVTPVTEKSTVVSILHLPPHIADSDITAKINSYNVNIVSPIYRKFYARKRGKSKITDGTRYFRVKFSQNVRSLPWSISFDIDGKTKYFRTIHNNQEKVCFKCCSPDHLARDCDQNRCYTCEEYGHISLNCPNKKCSECNKDWEDCECETTDSEEDDTDDECDTDEGLNHDEQEITMMDVDQIDKAETNQTERANKSETKNQHTLLETQRKGTITGHQNLSEVKLQTVKSHSTLKETQTTTETTGEQNSSEKREKKPQLDSQRMVLEKQKKEITKEQNSREKTENKTQTSIQNKIPEQQTKRATINETAASENEKCVRHTTGDSLKPSAKIVQKSGKMNTEISQGTDIQDIGRKYTEANVKCQKDDEMTQNITINPSQSQQVRPRRKKIKVTPNLSCARKPVEEDNDKIQDEQK